MAKMIWARRMVHHLFCRRAHYYGYPDWLVDNFGHWRG